jgi:ribosomal protein L13
MEGAVVVVDCRAHMLGRLASVLAKELMSGQHVVRAAFSALPEGYGG